MIRFSVIATVAALSLLTATPCFAVTIFVSNEKDNTVTVIDGDTLEVKKTIKTARRPRGIILSPDSKELFVAAGDGDIMDVIDTSKLEITRQLESGPDPELMAVDPKGEVIYIANEDDSLVTIMDIKSGDVLAEVPVGVEPEGMTVSPDGKYTVATSESTSMAHVIDNAQRKLIANVLVDSRPREAKFTHDGKELWVSSEVGGSISVIDPATWKVVKKITFEVPGVRRVRSTTFRGATEISAQFDATTDMVVALQQAQGKIAELRGELPSDLDLVIERLTPAAFPFLSVNLTGGLPAADLYDYAYFVMRPALSRVPGVGNVEVLASDTREIEVIADPAKLTAAQLTIGDVADSLKASNQLTPVGRYPSGGLQHLVLASGLWKTIEDIGVTPIAVKGTAAIRVADVASVQRGALTSSDAGTIPRCRATPAWPRAASVMRWCRRRACRRRARPPPVRRSASPHRRG